MLDGEVCHDVVSAGEQFAAGRLGLWLVLVEPQAPVLLAAARDARRAADRSHRTRGRTHVAQKRAGGRERVDAHRRVQVVEGGELVEAVDGGGQRVGRAERHLSAHIGGRVGVELLGVESRQRRRAERLPAAGHGDGHVEGRVHAHVHGHRAHPDADTHSHAEVHGGRAAVHVARVERQVRDGERRRSALQESRRDRTAGPSGPPATDAARLLRDGSIEVRGGAHSGGGGC